MLNVDALNLVFRLVVLLGFSISNLLGLVVSPIFFLLLSIDDLNRVVSLVVLYSIFSSVICYFKHNCSFFVRFSG